MSQYRFEKFQFNSSNGELSNVENVESTPLQLRYKVSILLKYLIDNSDRVIPKDELLDQLWQQSEYRENSLTQSIRELRKALGDKASEPKFIKTYQQRGYQWVCPFENQTEADQSVNNNQTPHRFKWLSITNMALALVAIMLLVLSFFVVNSTTSDTAQTTNRSLLVLPFINQTGNKTMDWLELGLADMVANELASQGSLQIIPPAMANRLFAGSELSWPPLAIDIRALLAKQDIDKALLANVQLHKGQQVLAFQIISQTGGVQQGAMTYTSLTNATNAVANQLLHLLSGQSGSFSVISEEESGANALAKQTLARGLQAAHTTGQMDAFKFFQASYILAPNQTWSAAYMAKSQVLTGSWQEAETNMLALIEDPQQQPSLLAFVHYWLAELAFRRGDQAELTKQIAMAQTLAEQSGKHDILIQVYRLRAQQAWHKMQWQTYQHWIEQASALFPQENDLEMQADRLFYLGNPPAHGPDKSPETHLLLDQERLEKAHNFYQQLGNQPKIADSLFAIAQNYNVAIARRQQALQQAIELYKQLNQPFELATALAYQGFVFIQLKQGKAAQGPLSAAQNISQTLGATALEQTIHFYLAFAQLDQGLDQSSLGRHGQNRTAILGAIADFKSLLPKLALSANQANTLFMLGWAYSDLGQYDQALDYLKKAELNYRQLKLSTSLGYSRYSQMRIYLDLADFDAVIALGNANKATTKLEYTYLARAYYEKGLYKKASTTLLNLKQALPTQWQNQDAQRLATYQAATVSQTKTELPAEPVAHGVYCESDWLVEKG
ncbi:winged helix-turn-helix domain-containing protein [Motilimonas sp. 1_MG-2023]|uniref:winged helix-turn-helix domain-containing protein n=1 Tax=Motilimonas sp. 1_MG-2023 TaxID=3062672 RepID=UPI0026E47DA4|nr:winged helix-turn-helix domain-containing protein [Motilimonas sp. 1_MG-2023]MDO6525942.1 winged helix-turn-helix domain-containing protein [Motilimonas sp. 1_MG-2023]